MITILLEIVSYWLGTGIIMWLLMTACLYFAVLCEKICDFVSTAK